MPENDEQNVSAGAQTPAETDRERFERERLTRRQALRKFGITAGMATFAMFSVDDLARMVGKAMQQRAGDGKVAGRVAQEFQQAGIAFAGSGPSNPTHTLCDSKRGDCSGCTNTTIGGCCAGSSNQYQCCAKTTTPKAKAACCNGVALQDAGYNNTPPIGASGLNYTLFYEQCMNTVKL